MSTIRVSVHLVNGELLKDSKEMDFWQELQSLQSLDQ